VVTREFRLKVELWKARSPDVRADGSETRP
jgi:hypothetical protein